VPEEIIPDLSIPLKEGANYFTNGSKALRLKVESSELVAV